MDRERLYYLVNSHFDDEITSEEQSELEAMLLHDEAARHWFWRYAQFENSLRDAGQRHTAVDEAEDSIETRLRPAMPTPRSVAGSERSDPPWTSRLARRIHWARHPVYFAVATVTLAVAFWISFAVLIGPDWRNPLRMADDPEVAVTDGIVARLVWIDRARWEGFAPSGRGMLAGQKLILQSGLAELHYATGAVVILEGPAEFVVGANVELGTRNAEQVTAPSSELRAPSSNRGYLALGKLVARCETSDSKGFTLATPHARVEDLGTEFGVEVQRDGAAEVVVLAGVVEVVRGGRGNGPEQRLRLTKDQGAFVEANGDTIARRNQVAVRFDSAMQSRLQRRRPTLTATDVQGELTFVAYHDLGGEASPGNITTQSDVATTIDLIKFADGSDTGIDFRIAGANMIDTRTVDDDGHAATRPPNVGTPAADLFLAGGIDLDDGFVSKKGGTMTFTCTGLDPNRLYDMALYGDRNERADGVERFTLRGAAAATNRSSTGVVNTINTDMETRPNAPVGHVVRWTDIAPGPGGSITIDISTSGLNIAYLSAVRLAEHAAQSNEANKESE